MLREGWRTVHTSVEDLYLAVESRLPAAVVDYSGRVALRRIAGTLPAWVETFGFEVRLGRGDARVDFGVGMSGARGAHRHLASAVDPSLEAAVAADARWLRIRDFARRWTQGGRDLQQRMPLLFLEVDAAAAGAAVPVPSVFVGMDWTAADLGLAGRQGRDFGAGLLDTLGALEILRGERLDGATGSCLGRCFEALPDGSLVLHVAVMLGRPEAGIRISTVVPRHRALSYLGAIGWRGSHDELERTLEILAPHAAFGDATAPLQLDLDVGAGIGPAVGVGLWPRGRGLWGDLLSALVDARLCEVEKRAALLSWPGSAPGLAETARGPLLCRLERDIFHAKITVGATGGPSAKAYFGVTVQRAVH